MASAGSTAFHAWRWCECMSLGKLPAFSVYQRGRSSQAPWSAGSALATHLGNQDTVTLYDDAMECGQGTRPMPRLHAAGRAAAWSGEVHGECGDGAL